MKELNAFVGLGVQKNASLSRLPKPSEAVKYVHSGQLRTRLTRSTELFDGSPIVCRGRVRPGSRALRLWCSPPSAAARANWLRCSFCTMSRRRSISACAFERLSRRAASVRTIHCSVTTSSGRAARSMFMTRNRR